MKIFEVRCRAARVIFAAARSGGPLAPRPAVSLTTNTPPPPLQIDDEKKLVTLYEKRMAQEVEGDSLGDEFKGYVFRCV